MAATWWDTALFPLPSPGSPRSWTRPDGAGGVVIGWYEISGARNAYVQHVLANGTLKFAAPVANTGPATGRIRIGAGLAYNTTTGEYYLCSTDSSTPTQGNYGVIA